MTALAGHRDPGCQPSPSGHRLLTALAAARGEEALSSLLADLDLRVQEMLACTPDQCPADLADDGQTRSLERVFDLVSRFNERLTARLIEQAVGELETTGGQVCPLPFCWITLGSDARGEQVIRTDQDNALIYADPVPGQEEVAAAYFASLASQVNQSLDRLGFDLCPGQVMASNPLWCRSLSRWLAALDDWVGSSDPMAVRHLTILLDFKAVFGDRRLAALLHAKVFSSFEAHPAASHFLVRDDRLFAPPKTLFNRIRTRREPGCSRCFNLKTQAIAHLVNGARLFAVNHRIRTPATLRRLDTLAEDGVLTPEEHADVRSAFAFLTRMKIRRHLARAGAPGTPPRLPANHMDVSALDRQEKQAFHLALDAVARFQKKTAAAYNQNWMNFFN